MPAVALTALFSAAEARGFAAAGVLGVFAGAPALRAAAFAGLSFAASTSALRRAALGFAASSGDFAKYSSFGKSLRPDRIVAECGLEDLALALSMASGG